uniref:Uncharacterized protein n=4 Tax=Aegilops tauschii subsp. strangulata TaxID=200361 RepID=A0A453QRZ2_AEGTS
TASFLSQSDLLLTRDFLRRSRLPSSRPRVRQRMGGCGAGGPICAARTRLTRGTLDPVTHQSPVVGPADQRGDRSTLHHHSASAHPSSAHPSSSMCAAWEGSSSPLDQSHTAIRSSLHSPPPLLLHLNFGRTCISVPTPCYQRKPQASLSG